MKRFIISCILMVCFMGCTAIKTQISKLSGAEAAKTREIATLQADFSQKLEANTAALNAAKELQANALKGQLKGAANSFYAQDQLYRTIPVPVRTDLIWHNYSLEGWTAVGNIMPDYEVMLKINDRLKKELDEKQTTLADLQKTHQAVLAENQKLNDATKAANDRIEALVKERTAAEVIFDKQLADKQGELVKLSAQRADLEKQRADDAAAIHAMKMKLSMIAGGLALLCIAGIIYSPVGKGGLAVFGAVSGLASVGIWYLTGPVILGVVVVVAVIAAGWGLYKHHSSDKTVVALTSFLHDKGQLASADLAEWTTKYVKNGNGGTIAVPDKAVLKVIDDKLIAGNKL